MKPMIGLIPLWDDEKESLWMYPGYMDGIRAAGGIPIMFPLTDDKDEIDRMMDLVQGVLFTGGHDVDPQIYGETAIDASVECCEARDKMEAYVLKLCLEQDKAVLGICRGLQFINAELGGTLYQDLPTQHPSEVQHRQGPPYYVPIHDVEIMKDTPLYDLIGNETLAVNSCHHQAIKELAPGLKAMAVSTDGLIEAFCKEDQHFFWSVQWHPEFAYKEDEQEMKILEAFVKSMS